MPWLNVRIIETERKSDDKISEPVLIIAVLLVTLRNTFLNRPKKNPVYINTGFG